MPGKNNGFGQRPSQAAQSFSVDELVGRRVQQRRTALNIPIDELARTIGITPMQLEAFESGKVRFDPQLLAEIARILGVSAAWFFIRTDD
jgi:transcriptional regulator with XRE-family HTH domain